MARVVSGLAVRQRLVSVVVWLRFLCQASVMTLSADRDTVTFIKNFLIQTLSLGEGNCIKFPRQKLFTATVLGQCQFGVTVDRKVFHQGIMEVLPVGIENQSFAANVYRPIILI